MYLLQESFNEIYEENYEDGEIFLYKYLFYISSIISFNKISND